VKVVLVFPPMAEPAQPYSALPALTAFLKERGWQNVDQLDINIEFVRYLLSPGQLEKALEKIEKRIECLNRMEALDDDEMAEYGLLVDAAVKAPFVVQGIQSAVEELREPGCFRDISRLNRSRRLVQEALEMVSASTHPLRLSFANAPGPNFGRPEVLQTWANDRNRNPYYLFFLEKILPGLQQSKPDIIGISITYYGQVLPAATLAFLIKKKLPGIPVVLGGNIISLWYDTLDTCPELFGWCDYIIPFEGESALHGLLTALQDKQSPDSVPNLVYVSRGKIRKNSIIPENIDLLPTPDYRGLPLDHYLSPFPVFLLSTSRGCYWSKCRFCSVSAAMPRGNRVRSPAKIHQDIMTIWKRHNSPYIAFGDDCVSPAMLKALSAFLREKGPAIFWQCEVRFENALEISLLQEIKAAGCINLIFGLESYSARVLAAMGKGVKKYLVKRILADCRKVGIAFNLQFFFGYPGETETDALETAGFIKKQAYGAASFSFGTFELLRQSEVEQNPDAYRLQVEDRNAVPLAIAYEYTPEAEHAGRIKKELQDELYNRNMYSHVSLSITAHTLIFLHLSGIAAMGNIYDKKGTNGKKTGRNINLMESRLVHSPYQTAGFFTHLPRNPAEETSNPHFPDEKAEHLLLYDYPADELVEVTPIVLWFLKKLDGTTTPSQLLVHFENEISSSVEDRKFIYKALKELYDREMLFIPAT